MDLRLSGAKILVTGGSRGLGLAIAEGVAAEGAAVGLLARTPQTLTQAAQQVARHGGPVCTRSVDVTDLSALAAAVEQIGEELGGLDGLVANAGGTVGNGNLLSGDPEEFVQTFRLNGGHAVAAIKAALPRLSNAAAPAVVIIASITGMRAAPRTAYAAAKAGEIHLAATLAQELAAQRVRVNSVSPGSILFPGGSWERFAEQHPERFAEFQHREFPWQRLGRPDEVADAVTFLLSPRASWITGANIVIDGAQRYPSARLFGD